MPANQQNTLGADYLDDVFEVFEDYKKVWKGTELPLETEREFKIQIASYKGIPVYFNGLIDEVFTDAIGDHKTFSQKPDSSIMFMNQQSMLYVKALELETGQKVSKFKWDYIKSKPAERPMWLEKSGRFSEANSTKITPYSWERACIERGVTDPDIIGKGEKYTENIPNFFFRQEVDVIPAMVDRVWDDFKYIVKDIITKGHLNRVMNITRDCSWCNYRPICYGSFTGADVDYIKKTDFGPKKDRKPKK